MMDSRLGRLLLIVAPSLSAPLAALAEQPVHCSPAFLVSDAPGRNIYVADESGSRVIHVDATRRSVVREIALPERPTGLALNKAADRLYVSSQSPTGAVFVIDLDDGRVATVLRAGHTSMAPVLNADESILYVCNRFNDSLSVIDLKSRTELKRLQLVREPVASTLAPDGRLLAVAHDRADDAANGPDVACAVSLIDTRTNEVIASIRLPNGSIGGRGICISPDGRYALASHILARNHVPATQLAKGWIITNAVSILDLKKREFLGTVILDDVGRGAANPWGIECTEDGRKLLVALAGVHEIVVLDLPEMLKRIHDFGNGRRGTARKTGDPGYDEKTYTSFDFLDGLKKRIPLVGKGPRHITLAGGRVVAGMYFSGTLEAIDCRDVDAKPASILSLGEQPGGEVRRGERLFNDASICFQGWQSCASCHPGGRADGLNWDLTNDGIGNSKNAKSLLFAHRTPPSTMTGVFESLDECVPFELRTILFTDLPDRDAEAIAGYIKSLRPLPSPHLENGELSTSAARGREVFKKAGCAKCHQGDYYTTLKTRNVGTYAVSDHQRDFDIPSLREVWRTAPYLHDGRATTIREVITRFNPDDKHGETSKLTEREIADLVRFVLSL